MVVDEWRDYRREREHDCRTRGVTSRGITSRGIASRRITNRRITSRWDDQARRIG